ncbi:MAG: hypothetical protein V5A43_03145 [Haloarculaceae archaeon]
MLLIVSYSREARRSLRNVCRSHEDAVVGRFGRAALLEATEFGAFLALRLREKHATAVQVERTRSFNEFEDVREEIRAAATAYEDRGERATPYAKFAAGRSLPSKEEMRGSEL